MRKCTSNCPIWMAFHKKVGVFALGVVTILLGYIIIYNQTDLYLIMKVVRKNHTCEMYGNNVKWVNFSSDVFRLYLYSAFYDDRPSLLSDPVIRIIAVSDPFESLNAFKVTQLYCILQYDSNSTNAAAVLMVDEPKAISIETNLNKREAMRYVYTCPSVKGRIPNAVAISTTPDANSSVCIAVTVPHKPEKQRDFCICPQAAYGLTLNPTRLIEWMELQKILGVSLVGIYVLSASESVLNVFKHYAAEGFVELREMNYIYASVKDTDEEFWLHLTPAINDCIYRHMYEFRRIAVMDFDEIIMPRNEDNLSDLIAHLDQAHANKRARTVNYLFRNNYFFLDLPHDDSISRHLSFLRFRRKVALSPSGYSMKSIIDPQSCINMHNHYCWGLTASYSKYGKTVYVDPKIALNQHYKKCHFSKETCQTMLQNSTQDDVMLRLNDTLTKNVRDTIKAITGMEM